MKGFTLKIARNALLAVIAVTAVISCVDTIDVQGFVTESERVQELILKGAEPVDIQINIGDPQLPGTEITFNISAEIIFSQADLFDSSKNKVTISINNASEFTNIKWRCNGRQFSQTTGTLSIDFSANESYDMGLNAVGSHLITVEATRGGLVYSGAVKVTVS